MNKRVLYFMFLFIVILAYAGIKSTYANFSSGYTTENDAVGLNLNFDLKIDNFEEYEEIIVQSNSYEVFDVNIYNSTVDKLYYGIWYKMITPLEINSDIMIGRLEDNLTSMSGELDSLADKTATVIIKNNGVNDIKVAIGVESSKSGTDDIEYLSGKSLINNSFKEIDYNYDNNTKRYISSIDSNKFFILSSSSFDYDDSNSKLREFFPKRDGVFFVEVWGPKNGDINGSYGSGIIKLDEYDKLYINVDRDITDIRLSDSDNDDGLLSRIMYVGNINSSYYISGLMGIKSPYFASDELNKKCITGMEDIECSYHFSGKVFKNIEYISGDREMPSYKDNNKMVGNDSSGYVRITSVVPSIEIPELKVVVGEELDTSGIVCKSSLNGCHVVRVLPLSTKNEALGSHKLSIMVSDDDGLVYKYMADYEVVEK